MSQWNIASFSKEEQDKVAVDKVAAAVALAGKDEQARRAGTC
ncbi:putative inner membrane protein [Klebsiella pneumoniae]|nr:putative inner membrane protein [Klebsiella pneumoniae]